MLDMLKKLTLDEAMEMIRAEVERAMKKHPTPMHGPHEGYAVILEEVDEMWDEIKGDDPHMTRKEVVHVGAMAVRFLVDVIAK